MQQEKIKFNSEHLAEIVKQFFSEFSCIPIKIGGEIKLVFWDCPNCLRSNVSQFDGASRDCWRKIYGTQECIDKFTPFDTEGKRFYWLKETIKYINDLLGQRGY